MKEWVGERVCKKYGYWEGKEKIWNVLKIEKCEGLEENLICEAS